MIPGDTAEQAQAQLLQIVKRVAQQQMPPLEVGQVELGRPRTFGSAYGQVSLSITVTCRIEDLVNFLIARSALSRSLPERKRFVLEPRIPS